MPKKDFETLRKEFWAKRDELTRHVEQFNKLFQKYPAERFEGSAARLYNSYSVILRDLYNYVEELYKENAELRKEIDQLKKQ
jgi:cell division protein FtsB